MRVAELYPGYRVETKARLITRDEILDFAQRYDPQPLHLDPEHAKKCGFDDVIAPGFMTVAVAWGLFIETGVMGNHGEGGIALKHLRWHQPVYPEDELRAVVTFTEVRTTSSGRGLVGILFEVYNQQGSCVLVFETVGLHAL